MGQGAHWHDIYRQLFVDLQIQQAVDVDIDNRIRILDVYCRQHIHTGWVVPRFHLKGGLWIMLLDQPLDLFNGGLERTRLPPLGGSPPPWSGK